MARRCGAKRIFKSKCSKHHICGPIFEVETSAVARSNCQVEMRKAPQVRSHFWSFDVEKWHAAVAGSKKNWRARATFRSNWHAAVTRNKLASQMFKNRGSRATFWRLDVEKWHAGVVRFASQNVQNTWQNTCVLTHFGHYDVDKAPQLYHKERDYRQFPNVVAMRLTVHTCQSILLCFFQVWHLFLTFSLLYIQLSFDFLI